MNEEEFNELMNSRHFSTENLVHWEAEVRASTSLAMKLGTALWGETLEDAQRQLLASHPEIPAEFKLADVRKLLQWTSKMASAVPALQRMHGVPPAKFLSPNAVTLWEARRELVRRAVEYLENR